MTTPAVLSRATYIQGALWGVFAISIWVGWIIFTRFGVTTTLTAYDITALRFGCAGLVMLPLVWRDGWGIARAGWSTWLIMVSCAGVPYVLLASSGLRFAPAAHAGALVPGTMPLWAALLAMLFLKEQISGLRRLGLMLIPLGIAVILGGGLTDFASGHWKGHLLFLSAAMTWASFTVAVRRAGLQPLHAAAVVSVVSMLVYLPIYALFLPHRIAQASWGVIVSQTLYQGIAVSIISLVAYARAVSILGASLGASFASLVPVLAMLGAIPLLGEVPAGYDYLGIAAVTCGVFLSSGAYQVFLKKN
ncbi:MAG: DMT family transporter [Betaproteobacteria bacterium]|nr:DMT family transporter [Betaproteobacteria bacterium]